MKGKRTVVKKYAGVYRRKTTKGECYDINYRDGNGQLVWEKIGYAHEGYNAQKAQLVRNERIKAIRHGDELPSKKKAVMTFSEAHKEYIKSQESDGRVIRHDKGHYENHLKKPFGAKRLDQIAPFAIEKFKQQKRNDGYSPAAILQFIRLIGAVYKKMASFGLYHGQNPVENVKKPILDNSKTRYLEWDEWNALLDYLKNNCAYNLYAQTALSLYQGARKIEILRLTPEDIDFEKGYITLHGKGDANAKVKDRKNPMEPKLAKILKGVSMKPGKPLFGYFHHAAFNKAVDALKLNDGIPEKHKDRFTFHSCRHTYASWMVMITKNIYVVSKLLGHASIKMTERYAHLIQGEKEGAMKLFSEKIEEMNRKPAEVIELKM